MESPRKVQVTDGHDSLAYWDRARPWLTSLFDRKGFQVYDVVIAVPGAQPDQQRGLWLVSVVRFRDKSVLRVCCMEFVQFGCPVDKPMQLSLLGKVGLRILVQWSVHHQLRMGL